ncbi:MAG: DUF423 domain-containing protein [Chitinophagaceae bacterium]|nr:DUF423 domain-containing protein [Chitinophagaceae bacterium]
MHSVYVMTGTFLAGLAVILGAFGAHGLKKIVPPETVTTFQTGVQYQMYHALALIFVGMLFEKADNSMMKWAGICFIIGILLFSGSLYLITLLKAKNTVGLSGIGIITPIGGLFFVAGWLLMLIGVWKSIR